MYPRATPRVTWNICRATGNSVSFVEQRKFGKYYNNLQSRIRDIQIENERLRKEIHHVTT